MSNRFHPKYHRQNHHTTPRDNNPDAGHDPIASPDQPFLGDFHLYGNLSANGSLTAKDVYFTTISFPVSYTTGNFNVSLTANSYVFCIVTGSTTLNFVDITPGKTIKILLSSNVGTSSLLTLPNEPTYLGWGKPEYLLSGGVSLLSVDSFGTQLSSLAITHNNNDFYAYLVI